MRRLLEAAGLVAGLAALATYNTNTDSPGLRPMMTPGEASQRANAMAAVAAASGLYVPRNREDESMVLGRSKKASQRIGLYEWLQLIRDLGWPCEQDVFETRLDAWDLEHEVTPTLDSAEGVDSEGTEE